jgi:hypothetical protein
MSDCASQRPDRPAARRRAKMVPPEDAGVVLLAQIKRRLKIVERLAVEEVSKRPAEMVV